MDTLISAYREIYNFLVATNLLVSYLLFASLILFIIILDFLRIKKKLSINEGTYQLISILIFFFFLYLYIELFQMLNIRINEYSDGKLTSDIKIFELTSNYFKHKIGSTYTLQVIVLLSGIFAFFIKLQYTLLNKQIFDKNNASLLINFIIILNIFTILTFTDHLKYDEFSISESVAIELSNPSYFFSILLITSIIIFVITLLFKKKLTHSVFLSANVD